MEPDMSEETVPTNVAVLITCLMSAAFFVAVSYPQVFNNAPKKELDELKRRYDSAQTYWQARKDSVVVLQKRIDTVIANKTIYINTITRERQERVAYIKVMSADSLVLVFRKELDSARSK
jgi:ATP-dependent helicase/DNAse subunit B